MKQLPPTLVHSGYNLAQIERTDTTAIYSKQKPGYHNDHFEVIRIRIAPAKVFPDGRSSPEREVYPVSESWGTDGFTLPTLEHARAVANDLENEADAETIRATLSRLRHERPQTAHRV